MGKMVKLQGIAASEGVAIGSCRIVSENKIIFKNKKISNSEVKDELIRFEKSIRFLVEEIDSLMEKYSFSKENKDILLSHKMILEDPEFHKNITNLIQKELLSLEQALTTHFTQLKKIFQNMKSDYLAERISDYEDVSNRFLKHITNDSADVFEHVQKGDIIVMTDISPSLLLNAVEHFAAGICTETGSRNAHSAIIARSLNLPMIVGVHSLLNNLKDNDKVILNGESGEVIISPTEEILRKFKKIRYNYLRRQRNLVKILDLESRTKDGKKVALMSNIELPEEIPLVHKNHSEGVGLFRTEFLFIDRNQLPNEEEQLAVYKQIAEDCSPHPAIIRTIDIGGDKLSSILNISHESNPNLGMRGIRISFLFPEIFKTQIRAILRANISGNLKIMFPMVSCVGEIIRAKKIISECVDELIKEKLDFNDNIKIGAMIEIPSAVVMSAELAEECDFLSIGTNDLIQYTLAADRDNENISEFYQSAHPAVLRLIKQTVENAHKKGKKVAVCGEMAADENFVKLLLGLGVDELSMSPTGLLRIKKIVINSHLKKLEKLAEKALKMKTSAEVLNLLKR